VVRREMPAAYTAMPDAPGRMSAALVDALADLHAVDYAALGLEQLGKGAGFIERQIEGWYQRWQRAKAEELPAMDRVYEWLRANRPQERPPKLDNVMFAADDPGRPVAVFDWDMCTLGDPLSDLGALLAYWTEPGDPANLRALAMMPAGDEQFWSRAELVCRYADRSGRDVAHIGFYHALGLYRIVVIIAQIYARYQRGQTQDRRFAAFGPLIPLMAQAALDVTRTIR
jgi:aminoglycoside phosphotransferase (APT) family kinase protein